VPNSTLPSDIYGPQTDTDIGDEKNPYLKLRQRFLNSGVAIGTVKAMRNLYTEALARVDKDPNFGSDQYVISEIFGEQELYREILRRDSATWWQRLSQRYVGDPRADIFRPEHIESVRKQGRPLEFGLGIDYESSISLATIFAPKDTAWLTFNNSTQLHEANEFLNITEMDSRIDDIQPDIASTLRPFSTFNEESGPPVTTWDNVSIFTDVWTGVAPAVIHHNAWQDNLKSRRERWWDKMWFQKHARVLYNDYVSSPTGPVALAGYPSPIEWWSPEKRKGGATNAGEWVGYEDMCAGTEVEVFRDGLGAWIPPGFSEEDSKPKQWAESHSSAEDTGKGDPTSSKHPESDPEKGVAPTAAVDGILHIAITETGGSHDEVVAALVHSFGSQEDAEVYLYQLLPRYGVKDIVGAFSLTNKINGPIGPDNFMRQGVKSVRPDIFVAVTCELDITRLKTQLDILLSEGKTYMFCVVHHADWWAKSELGLEEAIRPWVEKGMVEFWALSPHTARFLHDESIRKWSMVQSGNVSPLVRYFVPVFPVALPSHSESKELAFGLQGDYDSKRRDYKTIFERLGLFLKTDGSSGASPAQDTQGHSRNVTMHFLGHGEHPAVPDDVKDHVVFDERLDYIDYYSVLSRTFALLPAFASESYLDRKASSSVPAALIAGIPLVATKAIMNSYSYMTDETVWLQADEENDFDVVRRVLDMDSETRRKKNESVKKRCAEIVEGNTKRVKKWITEALEKIKKQSNGT
jgi:hypothetical protein